MSGEARHRLLLRQLRRLFKTERPEELSSEAVAAGLPALLNKVSETYDAADEDRALLEVSLDQTSEELVEINAQLREDLARVQALRRSLEYISSHDVLTGLANRRALIDNLGRTLSSQGCSAERPFALLFIDLDRFKTINDSHGHRTGDALLTAVGQRLHQQARELDVVARLGGDEFAMLLQGAGPQAAMRVAERVEVALREPFYLKSKTLKISASMGVVVSSDRVRDAAEMLGDADIAMYRAKAMGRARAVLFDADLHELALDRIALEHDLSMAVYREQLHLVYQPVLDLESGRLAGVEALLRWHHPTRGLIPPEVFIPLAEDNGSIVPIGAWVIRAAAAQLARWGDLLPAHSYVSVNISARQLAQADLLQVVLDALRKHDVDPKRLCVEITETSMLRGAGARDTLNKLRQHGVRVFMDDFGTGYASIANLVSFEVDVVKVDRRFVQGASGTGEELLRCILLLARSLHMTTVAEGIEQRAHLELVREMGADFGQGFLFARPMSADALTRWCKDRALREVV